jgi:hypothetical protein
LKIKKKRKKKKFEGAGKRTVMIRDEVKPVSAEVCAVACLYTSC